MFGSCLRASLNKRKQQLLVIHPEHIVRTDQLRFQRHSGLHLLIIQPCHGLIQTKIPCAEAILHNKVLEYPFLQLLQLLLFTPEAYNVDLLLQLAAMQLIRRSQRRGLLEGNEAVYLRLIQ